MVLLFVPTDLLQFNKSFSTALRHTQKLLSPPQKLFKELFLAENSFPHAGVHMLLCEKEKRKKKQQENFVQCQHHKRKMHKIVRRKDLLRP